MLDKTLYDVYANNCISQEKYAEFFQCLKAENVSDTEEICRAVEAIEEFAFESGLKMAIGVLKELNGEKDDFLSKMEI